MECSTLQIGPVAFVQTGPGAADTSQLDPAYQAFYHARAQAGSGPCRSLPLACCAPPRPVPSTPPLFQAGRNWAVWEDRGEFLFCAGLRDPATPRSRCRVDPDFHAATLEGAPLRYPLDQALCWGMLGGCQGLLLHAAGVVRDGRAWVLAGPSGAGKSTLSEQCRQEGWQSLSDDRVILYRREGVWTVAGTPWCGSGRHADAGEAPLAGVAFLRQHPSLDALTPMARPEAHAAFLKVTGIPWFHEPWSDACLTVLQDLLEVIQPWEFFFTRRNSAPRTLTSFNTYQELS